MNRNRYYSTYRKTDRPLARSRAASLALMHEYALHNPGCTRSQFAVLLGIQAHSPHMASLCDSAVILGLLEQEIDHSVYPFMYRYRAV